MTFRSPNDASIFENGRLKPGIYKIQNVYSQTYLDIHEHSREACCRPARNLDQGRGLWDIRPLGAGYSVQRVEDGKPDQFCAPMEGIKGGTPLFVGAYPVAWRIEIFDDDKHRGFEYVRIFWGTSKSAWDLDYGRDGNGTKVHFWANNEPVAWQIWKLIPQKVDGAPKPPQASSESDGSGPLPPYDGGTNGQSSTRAQYTESEHDEFGTTVSEVTVVTTVTNSTITTRKKYRVEEA